MELITVARANNSFDAHVLRSRLQFHSIPALIYFENGGPIPELTGEFIGGVRIVVPEQYEEEARFILSRQAE